MSHSDDKETLRPQRLSGLSSQLLVLLGLTGFAITEPILTIFGANPGLFYFYNIDNFLLIGAFALSIALIPSMLLQLLTIIVRAAHKSSAYNFHCTVVFALVALWLVQLAKWSLNVDSPTILVTFSIIGAIAFILAYRIWPAINGWLQIAAIAPIISVGVFLVSSDAGSLIRHSDIEAAQHNDAKQRPSVLFVMLDELPTMALFDETLLVDKERFPNISALSKQSTWYRHYSVLAGRTDFSVSSILTGNDPVQTPPNIENLPNNLFTLLAPTHFLTVFETLTELCGLPQCSEGAPGAPILKPEAQFLGILSKAVSLLFSRVSPTKREESRLDDFEEDLGITRSSDTKAADTMIANILGTAGTKWTKKKPKRLEKFVATFVDTEKPALYFLHLEMPHLPWRFYETGELYSLPMDRIPLSGGNNDGGEWLAKLTEYRFMMQTQYTDELLGIVFSRLKSLGLWDDMLVLVTADHGRSFRLNTDSRKLGPETYDNIAYAPLFIKRPHQQRGQVDDSNIMAYDLLPTIADILDIEIPWPTAGFAVGQSGIIQRGNQKVVFSATTHRKVVDGKLPGELGLKQTFSDQEYFPRYSSRRIGDLSPGIDPLTLLNEQLKVGSYMGRSPAEFKVRSGGRALVDELELLKKLPRKKAPLGVVMGNLEFEPDGDKVLIAINGRFVTASPLIDFNQVNHTFIAMLPSGVLKARNSIGVFLVEKNGLRELKVHR